MFVLRNAVSLGFKTGNDHRDEPILLFSQPTDVITQDIPYSIDFILIDMLISD